MARQHQKIPSPRGGDVQPRGQILRAPAALPLPHGPRFRVLALFGRRPPERAVGIVIADVRKPAQLPA
jgi:hypothetical protein